MPPIPPPQLGAPIPLNQHAAADSQSLNRRASARRPEAAAEDVAGPGVGIIDSREFVSNRDASVTPEADSNVDSSYAIDEHADQRQALASAGRTPIMRLPATAEQRERIMRDPLVLQALDLFEGTIVNMEREVSAGPPEAEEDSE